MKRSLLALAVLGAFATSAQAQSNITIYGSFDAGVRHTDNVNAAGQDRLTMGSTGTFNSNRIGFRGVEELGGGLRARFNLEAGFNSGTGALNNANNQLFERQAAVGIGGNWGFIDFGRQYTNAFLTIAAYDPLGYKFPGLALAVPATAGTRYNNDIKYTGTFGPITARAEWALGEEAGSESRGAARGVSANYSSGPLALGAAYTRRDSATVAATPTTPAVAGGLDTEHWTVGGAFKFGPARLSVGYVNQETDLPAVVADRKDRWLWAGVNYALTPALELTAAHYKNRATGGATGERDFSILYATYAFSKRTSLYTGVDLRQDDGVFRASFAERRVRGISVGVNHLF